MSSIPRYLEIAAHYGRCLAEYGDTHKGVDWPRQEEVERRHHVMLEVMAQPEPTQMIRLLDFGCGASHLYGTIEREGLTNITYTGMDISLDFVTLSRSKFPLNKYYCVDVISNPGPLAEIAPDYAIASGVFTQKLSLSHEEMWRFFKTIVLRLYAASSAGVAFNLVKPRWKSAGGYLFTPEISEVIDFVENELSHYFTLRADYEIDYEYTMYVYREARQRIASRRQDQEADPGA